MTEREKQIEAVQNVLVSNVTLEQQAYVIINALAPWLKGGAENPEFLSECVKQIGKAQTDLALRISKLESFGRWIAPDAKQAATTADRYSVSIMREKGSKWHAVVNDIDWVAAIEYADRWYGDPEVQQVRVENESEPAMEPVYLKRKP